MIDCMQTTCGIYTQMCFPEKRREVELLFDQVTLHYLTTKLIIPEKTT